MKHQYVVEVSDIKGEVLKTYLSPSIEKATYIVRSVHQFMHTPLATVVTLQKKCSACNRKIAFKQSTCRYHGGRSLEDIEKQETLIKLRKAVADMKSAAEELEKALTE